MIVSCRAEKYACPIRSILYYTFIVWNESPVITLHVIRERIFNARFLFWNRWTKFFIFWFVFSVQLITPEKSWFVNRLDIRIPSSVYKFSIVFQRNVIIIGIILIFTIDSLIEDWANSYIYETNFILLSARGNPYVSLNATYYKHKFLRIYHLQC